MRSGASVSQLRAERCVPRGARIGARAASGGGAGRSWPALYHPVPRMPAGASRMIRWFVILSLLQLVAFWKILGRMGFPPWLAIMASVPIVNLVLLYYVALTPWPSEARWASRPGAAAGRATRISDNFAATPRNTRS